MLTPPAPFWGRILKYLRHSLPTEKEKYTERRIGSQTAFGNS